MVFKKIFLKVIQASLLGIVFFGFSNCKNDKPASVENEQLSPLDQHPNVVFILADDLGYSDLSCYGQKRFNTPHIDALAEAGMLFTQHYSGSTVCAPSRSALLTGLHTGHTPIRGNKEILPEGQFPIADSVYTLAEVFKDAGYVTGAFGKWGLGYPGSEGDPNKQGFDQFYGYNCQRLAHHYYPYFLRDNQEIDSLLGNKGYNKEDYAPDKIHERAIAFIEENKGNPFFLFYPTSIPHAELAAPENLIGKYSGKLLPESDYIGYDEGPEYRNGPYESQKETHATYAAMIDYLDIKVGEIVKKVKDLGLIENTIFIFTSDNGPSREGGVDPEYFDSNGPLKGFKRDLYEGGVRVPLIVSWPGSIKQGTTTDHISAFWDFMPTFSDIVGKPLTNSKTDGISFLPTLVNDKNQKEHDYLYWEFHEKGGRQAIRKGKWKAVKYNVLSEPEKTIELYDLSLDIGEEHDVSSKFPEITSELTELIESSRTPSDIFKFSSETFLNSK